MSERVSETHCVVCSEPAVYRLVWIGRQPTPFRASGGLCATCEERGWYNKAIFKVERIEGATAVREGEDAWRNGIS